MLITRFRLSQTGMLHTSVCWIYELFSGAFEFWNVIEFCLSYRRLVLMVLTWRPTFLVVITLFAKKLKKKNSTEKSRLMRNSFIAFFPLPSYFSTCHLPGPIFMRLNFLLFAAIQCEPLEIARCTPAAALNWLEMVRSALICRVEVGYWWIFSRSCLF